ncbi:unnamed protein product [Callosobruchus maculatus]|uniref:C2H2-type domain-containing protein n=1 Tax=Callosobruchus maculatus TaxID=64391 RepID=A0A653CZ11_CALMS|nr:unnamed protein product [Callosobruchus maculatus]
MCKPCNATFKNNESLDNHILKKHPEFKVSIRSDLHECPYRPYCKYKTTIKTYLKSHMLSHSKEREITCKHCNMSFKRKYTLDNHIIKKHPDFIASVKRKIHEGSCCAFKTIHKSALDVHMLIHSADKVTHKGKHECSSCSFKAIHKSTIDRHMKTHSSDKFKGIHREIHQCSYCEFKAIHKSTLDRHMLTHSKDKVVTCKHCNIEFKNKEAVNEHVVRAHSGFLASLSCKIYSCTHCYYKTTIQHLFDKHFLKHHEVATDRGKC